MSSTADLLPRAARGAVCGLLATVPMSAVMLAGHRLLPPGEQYALPPEEIAAQVLEAGTSASNAPPPSPQALKHATVAAHFGYGALMGSVYAALMTGDKPAGPQAAVLRGAAFGVGVWTASYLGWIPALHLLTPAINHPARRNALMIGANALYGGVLGWLLRAADKP